MTVVCGELSGINTNLYPFSLIFRILNVCDEPPAVGTSAWSVCPFSVVMDIPTVETPNGTYIAKSHIYWKYHTRKT